MVRINKLNELINTTMNNVYKVSVLVSYWNPLLVISGSMDTQWSSVELETVWDNTIM
jgi:hypothetical protein